MEYIDSRESFRKGGSFSCPGRGANMPAQTSVLRFDERYAKLKQEYKIKG